MGDALRLLRRAVRRTGHTVCALDERCHLAGALILAELLAARDRVAIQSIMRPAGALPNELVALHPVTNHQAWLTRESLTLINRDGVIQGVLARSKITDAKGHRSCTTAREVKGIDQGVRLNQALWMLAEKMRKLNST